MSRNLLIQGRFLPLALLLTSLFAVLLVGCSKETGAPAETAAQKQSRQDKKD